MEVLLLKKKVMIVVIIVLILLFPFFKNTFKKYMAPDKVLVVGHHISDHAFTFTKEIKDPKKIAEYEAFFYEIKFIPGEYDEARYADVIMQINHKSGIFTHPLHIWFKDDEGIAFMWTSEEPNW